MFPIVLTLFSILNDSNLSFVAQVIAIWIMAAGLDLTQICGHQTGSYSFRSPILGGQITWLSA